MTVLWYWEPVQRVIQVQRVTLDPLDQPVRPVLPDQRKEVYLLFLAKPMDLMLQTMMGLFFHLGPDKIIREIMVLPWESIVV